MVKQMCRNLFHSTIQTIDQVHDMLNGWECHLLVKRFSIQNRCSNWATNRHPFLIERIIDLLGDLVAEANIKKMPVH